MRRALAGAEREGVRLRAEKGRAAEHLAGSIAEHERAEAESELAFYDAQTATEKAVELDAENVAAMDHVGGLLDALHTDLDSLEADLDAFIKGGK
jgi:CYTH domain-containing protein